MTPFCLKKCQYISSRLLYSDKIHFLLLKREYSINPLLPPIFLKDGGGRESKTGQVPNNSIYFAHFLSNMLGEGIVHCKLTFLLLFLIHILRITLRWIQLYFTSLVSKDSVFSHASGHSFLMLFCCIFCLA